MLWGSAARRAEPMEVSRDEMSSLWSRLVLFTRAYPTRRVLAQRTSSQFPLISTHTQTPAASASWSPRFATRSRRPPTGSAATSRMCLRYVYGPVGKERVGRRVGLGREWGSLGGPSRIGYAPRVSPRGDSRRATSRELEYRIADITVAQGEQVPLTESEIERCGSQGRSRGSSMQSSHRYWLRA